MTDATAKGVTRYSDVCMTDTQPSQYVRHTRKPEWGIGELVESDGGRHRFAFQDGQMRVFMTDGLALLVIAKPSEEERVGLAKYRPKADDGKPAKKRAVEAPVGTIERQVDIFTALFHGGFSNAKFLETNRGVATPKPTGKHIVLALAQTLLAEEPLRAVLTAKKAGAVFALIKKIASKSRGLAPAADLAVLSGLAADTTIDEAALGEALFSFLHGTDPIEARADAFLAALPENARTWSILGLFPAVFNPVERAPIDTMITLRQATIAGAQLASKETPNGADYVTLLETLGDVKIRLEELLQKPQDLLDIHLFGEITLAPTAAKKATAAKKKDVVPDSSRR